MASKDGVELRFKYHPEAHIGGTWIDSGSDLSEDSILAANAEIAGYLGPLHGQAEFTTMNVERTGGLTDLNFYSYYAEVGYFLTGEHMNWKQSAGQWKRVKVGHEVGNGGIGAWEVAARYSHLDLSDGNFSAAGRTNNWTAALNWWATNNVALRLNYVFSDRDLVTDTLKDDFVHALTARAQVVF